MIQTTKKSDNVTINFGEWFDKINGNTYYDAHIYIGNNSYQVRYQYGYNHGDKQAIDESLNAIGYRVRACKKDVHAPYRHIRVNCFGKKKRELFRETKKID